MNRERVKKETTKWVKEEIITTEQAEQITSLYPKRDRSFILMSFAGLFIGLGFLTFIASNWSVISNLTKMGILLFSMTIFYVAGYYIYQKKSVPTGASFLVIGLLIFGAGIFLTGQMYHYQFFSALPFLVWSLAGFVLYVFFRHPLLFLTALAILTVGQVYSGVVYGQFDWLIGLLLLMGFGHYTYHYARTLYGYLFAFSYGIHALVLTFANDQPYYWLFLYFLLLYLFGDLAYRTPLRLPFWIVGLSGGFVLLLFQVFLMTDEYPWEQLDKSWIFLGIWLLVLGGSIMMKLKNKDIDHFLDYILFLPVVYLSAVDVLSLLLLFVFSMGWLLLGYQRDNQEKIMIGTISFLISTISAYVHFAWDFLDKSLFFFIGGLMLFILSFLLEHKRRSWRKRETGGMEQ